MNLTQNRPEMLQIEPLRSLLKDKWDRFASKLFLINFVVYLMYLIIFTTVAFYRKEGQVRQKTFLCKLNQAQLCLNNFLSLSKDCKPFDLQPPFPIEDVPLDYLRCLGELISVLGAVRFFYKAVRKWNLVQLFTQKVKLNFKN